MDRPEALIRLLPTCLHWHSDGDVRVVGHRISLFDILDSHRGLGKSPETIAEEYELALELIHEVLDFADRHPTEVDAYMADCQARIDRLYSDYRPSPAALRISRLICGSRRRSMELPEFLTEQPKGEIVVTGHRIGLYSIIDRHQSGSSVDEIHEEFPSLETDLIQKVIDFGQSHRAEVDAYVAEYRAELDRQEAESEPSEALLRVRRKIAERATFARSQSES
jgi:uncharacterized protein (DUF433 family)